MKILFIDDEERRMSAFVEELQERGHTVIFEMDADKALARVQHENENFDVTILDVSLPPGKSFDPNETDGGTRTGLFFYDTLRRLRPKLKVIILTNVADPTVKDHFKNEDPKLCRVIRKALTLPHQLTKDVESF